MNESNSVFEFAQKTRPTRWDKSILALYRVYPSRKEIPEFVSRNTITFYRNKFRIHYSIGCMVLASIGFFGVSYAGNKTLESNNESLYTDYQKQLLKK